MLRRLLAHASSHASEASRTVRRRRAGGAQAARRLCSVCVRVGVVRIRVRIRIRSRVRLRVRIRIRVRLRVRIRIGVRDPEWR